MPSNSTGVAHPEARDDLSERLSELKRARTIIRKPRPTYLISIERSYDRVCQKYDQVSSIRSVDYDTLLSEAAARCKVTGMSTLSRVKYGCS